MPGHVKKGGKQEQDPGDPSFFLFYVLHHALIQMILRPSPFMFCIMPSFLHILIFIHLDPSPWLVLSFEMKKEDSLKPYGKIIGIL